MSLIDQRAILNSVGPRSRMPSTLIVPPGARGARSHPLQRDHSWQSRSIACAMVCRRVFLETGRSGARVTRWSGSRGTRTGQIRISGIQPGEEALEDAVRPRSVNRYVVFRRHRLRSPDLCVIPLPQWSSNAARVCLPQVLRSPIPAALWSTSMTDCKCLLGMESER